MFVSGSRYICIWSNYSDLTRPHPKWWFSKGSPLISGKSRLVKYDSIWPDVYLYVNICTYFPLKQSPLVLLRTAPQVSNLLLEAAEAAPASAIVGPGGGKPWMVIHQFRKKTGGDF